MPDVPVTVPLAAWPGRSHDSRLGGGCYGRRDAAGGGFNRAPMRAALGRADLARATPQDRHARLTRSPTGDVLE